MDVDIHDSAGLCVIRKYQGYFHGRIDIGDPGTTGCFSYRRALPRCGWPRSFCSLPYH